MVNIDVATYLLNRDVVTMTLSYNLLLSLLWLFRTILTTFCISTKKMLWLPIKIVSCLVFMTAIAFCSSCKIIVLTLWANPATIRELKVWIFLCIWLEVFFIFYFILCPLGSTNVDFFALDNRGILLFLLLMLLKLTLLLHLFCPGHEKCSVEHKLFV